LSFTAVTLSWILTTILAGRDRDGQSRNREASPPAGRPEAAKRTDYAYFIGLSCNSLRSGRLQAYQHFM